jgi:hypothetical protein
MSGARLAMGGRGKISRPDSIAACLILILGSVVHRSEPFRDMVGVLGVNGIGVTAA